MGDHKVLPQEGKKNILITSALPYVNNVPHLGNVVGSVLSADVFARYSRARGNITLFVCGTDEYGTATEVKAREEGLSEQALCDKYHKIHSDVYKWFNIGFDIFGRTPTEQQTTIAQDIFLKLHKNGFLEEKSESHLYCEEHSSFLSDRFVEGECPTCHDLGARGDQCDKCGRLLEPTQLINPRCKVDGATPKSRDTKHLFLSLDKLQPECEKWTKESQSRGIWSSNGVAITQNWLTEGLRPRAITRDLRWGTRIPKEMGDGYKDKVMYVWFDACIGYVSITACYTPEWEKWWRNPENVKLYQFLGKDNVPFHSVVFPSSQLGTREKWTMLHHLSTTEYLQYEGDKFSKSKGIGVFGTGAAETGLPSDVFRYYLLSHRPESGDTEFLWKDFVDANNNELLNNLGNFCNRIIKYVRSPIFVGIVPAYRSYLSSSSLSELSGLQKWAEEVDQMLKDYLQQMDAVKLRLGLQTAVRISAHGNLLLQSHRLDNKLAQSNPDLTAVVVGLALNHVHLLSTIFAPFLPTTSTSILEQLNLPPLQPIPEAWNFEVIQKAGVPEGHTLGEAKYLFSQIKPEKAEEWKIQFGGEALKKQLAEKEAKRLANKAAKDKKKAEKAASKTKGGNEEPSEKEIAEKKLGEGMLKAIEKDDQQRGDGDDVDGITEGVKAAALQND
ncbi:methionyl-tRNA synthetase [Viridothelium virens]|uniref:methionine--tRNA ligase n=1 Tax=Viridothelium virens TaxID=1048519 RepID=A0A6A6H6T1_VIRVR|nr:methionyl-tRNA synthetase [Viridothelium virens]